MRHSGRQLTVNAARLVRECISLVNKAHPPRLVTRPRAARALADAPSRYDGDMTKYSNNIRHIIAHRHSVLRAPLAVMKY